MWAWINMSKPKPKHPSKSLSLQAYALFLFKFLSTFHCEKTEQIHISLQNLLACNANKFCNGIVLIRSTNWSCVSSQAGRSVRETTVCRGFVIVSLVLSLKVCDVRWRCISPLNPLAGVSKPLPSDLQSLCR